MENIRFEKLKNGIEIAVSDEHTFGTDALLLADFAVVHKKDTVVDIGTGCGIIAFIIKLLHDPAVIYGIDIQKQAADQFALGIERSELDGMIPLCMDICDIDPEKVPLGNCGCVICNPPYKAAGQGIQSAGEAQKIARHEISCGLDDICKAAARLLKPSGRFYMCNRPERLADAVCAMRNSGIEPKRVRFVSKTSISAPWLFLIEGRRCGRPFMNVMPQLCMYEDGKLSAELCGIYERITGHDKGGQK